MKYVIINEKFEVKNPDSLIKDAFDQGLMNGEYTGNYGAADLLRYQVINADTHEVYDAFNTKEDAYFCIDAYETFDKKNGEYVENLYEVYDTVREIHV